ncbi:MAG: CpsD/CapB family tyrosine-protein kinase [Candidatus Omnitrophota bacterium]
MGKITDALKKVTDERIQRIQKKPELEYVIKKVENTRIEPHIVAFHDPSSPIGEQYKIIRTNIQSMRETRDLKTFLITSSISGEGKTVTTINLAMTMAHDLNNKSILLIDADMRKGRIAKYLGIHSNPGLSEVLKGEAEAEITFVSQDIENLTVMPSGRVPKNPAELLASKNMKNLLASMKTRFDYIFIDSPPIMPLTDPCVLGTIADGVIMIIQAGRTQRDIIRHAEQRLHQAHARTIGYIMTNVEYHLPHYLYRYVHKYSDEAYYRKETVGV